MPLIRSVFQDELDSVSQTLFDLSVMVSDSMARATKSVMTKDLKLAEEVITSDEKIDTVQHDLDARIIDIIARQQPVASDLRALVTALRMSADLERMGDLAHHVAKLVRLRHPEVQFQQNFLPWLKLSVKLRRRLQPRLALLFQLVTWHLPHRLKKMMT